MADIKYYDVLLKPVITEKSMQLMGEKKYTFLVHPEANKIQIREAVEKMFEATKVWLMRFIKFQERSCVHDLEVQGEATSADVEAQQIIQKIWLRSVMKAVTLNHRFSK